jgi:hypothetical protein
MKRSQQMDVLLTKKLLILLVTTLIVQISPAQDSHHFKHVTYKVAIHIISDNRSLTGYLSSLTDTSVNISSVPVNFNGYAINNLPSSEINYRNITALSVRRKGRGGRGLLIGTAGGALLGVVSGLASGDDHSTDGTLCIICTAGDKAKMYGVTFGLVGSLLGASFGSLKEHYFTIESKKESFDEFKWALVH